MFVPVMAPYFYQSTGSSGVIGGSTDPIKCYIEANPAPYRCEFFIGGAKADSSLVTCIETDPGWYELTYTPTTPWDVTKNGVYRCEAQNSQNPSSLDIAISVPS